MDKTLDYYRRLPYTILTELHRDDNGKPFWSAEIKEFDGCLGYGDTVAKAVNNLHEVFDVHVTSILEWGDEVPVPKTLSIRSQMQETWISQEVAQWVLETSKSEPNKTPDQTKNTSPLIVDKRIEGERVLV